MSHTLRRALHAIATAPQLTVPPLPTPLASPTAVLSLGKRKLESHAKHFQDLPSLFNARTEQLKEFGIPVQDRRAILWLLNKLRSVILHTPRLLLTS